MEKSNQYLVDTSTLKRSVPWIYFIIFFAVLNESVFNVSTPNIAKQFHLSDSSVSWVVTVFLIIFGMGTAIFGKLSDIYSIKKLILIGIVVYSLGSIVGFVFQQWYPIVILARAIQGAGGSAIPALIFVIVARFIKEEERGKLYGTLTSIISFAIGIGPVLGGYISETFHWSYLFLVPLPVLVAIPFFQKYLPKEKRRAGKVDIFGAVFLCIAVSSLILFTSKMEWIYLLIFIISISLFIFHIKRVTEPFIEPALFRNPLYRSGLMIGFLIFGTIMSVMFIMPLMLNKIYNLHSENIGFIMFPGAISAVIFGKVAGNLTVKRGNHFVVYLGLSLIIISLLVQSSSIGLWVWYISTALVFMYIGFSFVQTALLESVTQILPEEQIGVGMGLFNLISILSGAVVTALVAKTMEQNYLAFPLHPFISDPHAFLYANLLLLLSFIIIATVLLYLFSFGQKNYSIMKVDTEISTDK